MNHPGNAIGERVARVEFDRFAAASYPSSCLRANTSAIAWTAEAIESSGSAAKAARALPIASDNARCGSSVQRKKTLHTCASARPE
jgi:hypothetical protein